MTDTAAADFRWANGPQLRIPEGIGDVKYALNHKDKLYRELRLAEKEYELATRMYSACEITIVDFATIQRKLRKIYDDLCYMDRFHLIILDGKDGDPDYIHPMNAEQIK